MRRKVRANTAEEKKSLWNQLQPRLACLRSIPFSSASHAPDANLPIQTVSQRVGALISIVFFGTPDFNKITLNGN